MFFEQPGAYPFELIHSETTVLSNPVRVIRYKFKAKKRSYLVTLEEFSFGVFAIKYCGLKDRKSGKAYSMVYNDGDGIKVISTCLQIMLEMWKNKPSISFAFFAVPRESDHPKRRNKRSRYNIYESAMVNLFSPEDFVQYRDRNSCVYVLINQSVKKKRPMIRAIGKYLLSEFKIIFEPYIEKTRPARPDITIG